MTRRRTLPLLLACAFLATGAASRAEIETHPVRALSLPGEPVDVAVSPDGRWTFVLTAEGEVLVYKDDGTLEDRIPVGKGFDAVSSSTRGDQLYLMNRAKRSLQVVAVEFVREIDTAGAPFRGPADAPVTVVVFSDFQ